MKRINAQSFLSFFVLLIILSACNKQDTNLIEPRSTNNTNEFAVTLDGAGSGFTQSLLLNQNMENGTTGYWKGGYTYPQYSFNYSSMEYYSPSHSLEIEASKAPSDKFVYWAQTFKADEYVGKKITLTVMTKYYNVDGDGVMFVLRGDDTDFPQGSAEAFTTTQNKLVLTGSSDWQKLDVTLNEVPEGIKSLTVYMLIASSNGKVFFDDLSINATLPALAPTTIVNGNYEEGISSPDNWWVGNSSKAFEFSWDSSTYLSANHSAQIKCNTSNENFSFWAQTISAKNFVGKKIMLDVKMKGENLVGDGIYIAIRGDDTSFPQGYAETFSTTQNKTKIEGTFNWKSYSVSSDVIPSNIKSLTFYLIFAPHTSGKVNFDDVSLSSL